MVGGKTKNVAQPANRTTGYETGSNRLLIFFSKGCSKKVLVSLDIFQKCVNLAIKVVSSASHGLREWPALISIQSSLFGVVSNSLEQRFILLPHQLAPRS